MESIAASLERIADALKENNLLMEKALQPESGGQHLAVTSVGVADAAAEEAPHQLKVSVLQSEDSTTNPL